MFSMMNHRKPLLLLLLHLQLRLVAVNSLLPSTGTFTNHAVVQEVLPCLPDQTSALLRLKRSFSTTNYSTIAFRSWRAGTDCCRWEGVLCDAADGRVTSLDLGDCGLESHRLDPVLFELTSLRYLNLGGNNFNLSEIPSTGFQRLTKLTHLNLSSSNFAGQVPHKIGHHTNFLTFSNSSFMGNTRLCGPPLSQQCSNATTSNLVPHSSKTSVDVMLFLFAGLGFSVGFAVIIVVVWVLPVRQMS